MHTCKRLCINFVNNFQCKQYVLSEVNFRFLGVDFDIIITLESDAIKEVIFRDFNYLKLKLVFESPGTQSFGRFEGDTLSNKFDRCVFFQSTKVV